MDFYDSFEYLMNHIIFNEIFLQCLDIMVVKVNPKTNMVEDNYSLNTKVQIWLECGPYQNDCLTHDIDLDCGGDTFEEAIIELAKLVKKIYGEGEKALKKIAEKYE